MTLVAILAVSLATPFLGPQYFDRWFTMPRVLFTAQVPLVIAILTWRFVRSLRRDYELAPFVITLAVFGLSFVGLGISMYPYLIPNSVTLQMAAAPPSEPGVHARRRLGAGAGDPGVHRVVVLGVPRQGRGRGLPLNPRSDPQRRHSRADSAGWPSSGPRASPRSE